MSRWIANIALAGCFLGFGLWEISDPAYWVAYAPESLSTIADPKLLVLLHGIVMSIVAIGVLSGYAHRFFLILSVLILLEVLGTVWFTIGYGDIFIRDAALFLFAVAMLADARKQST
jgi:hypothetical protein